MKRILIRNKNNKIVAWIEQFKNGSFGYAFGNPKQSSYIMFTVDSLELARERINEAMEA